MISRELAGRVCLNCLIPSLPDRFLIELIFPTTNQTIRVLLQNYGSFSVYWTSLGTIYLNENIFKGLFTQDRFVYIENEISTNIVDHSSNGLAQIVYHKRTGNNYQARVRLYYHMHHANSKAFREYILGNVNSCVYVNKHFSGDKKMIVV